MAKTIIEKTTTGWKTAGFKDWIFGIAAGVVLFESLRMQNYIIAVLTVIIGGLYFYKRRRKY